MMLPESEQVSIRVKDLAEVEGQWMSDSQDVEFMRSFGFDINCNYDTFFVSQDGTVYGMLGIMPYLNKTVTKLGIFEEVEQK